MYINSWRQLVCLDKKFLQNDEFTHKIIPAYDSIAPTVLK